MTRIDELNAALAAANLGEAEVWPDWDADVIDGLPTYDW